MQTVARHHPEAARYVFLADADYDFSELDLPATVVTADRINIANFSQMAFRYTIIELNTAIKPFCVRWLFNDQHHVRAIYLDPDIYVDIPNHLFTDQRWMDLAPAFVPNTAILHHPGYNLAYWNLLHRPVTRGRGGWRAGGEPLHFVHFSAVDPLKPGEFSKHQTRFRTENLGGLRTLFETYVAQLLANGYEKYAKLPYAYGLLQRRSRGACSDAALFSPLLEDTTAELAGVSLIAIRDLRCDRAGFGAAEFLRESTGIMHGSGCNERICSASSPSIRKSDGAAF